MADTEAAARAGARAVEVGYEELPAVMSIEEAIEAGSFWEDYKGKVREGGGGWVGVRREVQERKLGVCWTARSEGAGAVARRACVRHACVVRARAANTLYATCRKLV